MSQSEENKGFEQITVTLPAIYWTVILASLEETINVISPQFEELRAKKANPANLPPAVRSSLIGPLFSRAVIVKALVDHGHMKKEALDGIGYDTLMSALPEDNTKK